MRTATLSLVMLLVYIGQSHAASPAWLPEDISLPITEHTLENGMRFLIVERHDSPTFSAYLRFQVGSVNETPGITGLAHLLEHMMFKGTTLFGSLDPSRELAILDRIDGCTTPFRPIEPKGHCPV